VSKHATLQLHVSEEAVTAQVSDALVPYVPVPGVNPISDYFLTANRLAAKLTTAPYDTDSEVLGLLLLGVVSAAEFYFRTAISMSLEVCPICRRHAESLSVPFGTFEFFSNSVISPSISAFESESLADSQKIKQKCRELTGFNMGDDSSVEAALKEFEILCELRHCLIHVRGVAGLKACRAFGTRRELQKLVVNKAQAFDLLKLSHNAVRATNRFLANSIANRWIDRDVLTGNWATDKQPFTKLVSSFWIRGEDSYQGVAWNAYRPFRKAVLAKQEAIAAKVDGGVVA
jgi:hypothetical protein